MKRAILLTTLIMAGCSSAPMTTSEAPMTQGAVKVGEEQTDWTSDTNTELFIQEAIKITEEYGRHVNPKTVWTVDPCGHGSGMVSILGLAKAIPDCTMWISIYLTPYDDDGDGVLDSYDIEGAHFDDVMNEYEVCTEKLDSYFKSLTDD